MKTKTQISTAIMVLISMSVIAQSGNTDDVYYSPQDDPVYTDEDGSSAPASDGEYKTVYDQEDGSNKRTTPDYSTTEQYVDEDGATNVTNNYYYDDDFVYDDYYDYSYTSRIRRFHRPVSSYGYYDPYYTNTYWYSNNAYDYGTSLYVSYPWWGSGVSWWLGLGWLGFGWGWGGSYGYGHHGYGYGYGHHGYGFGGYSSWYGYGGGYYDSYGYGGGCANGYNNGYYDGAYGGYNSGYYNSYDGTSYYYGHRGSTASNSAVASSNNHSVGAAYQAQYTPTTNWYASVDAPSNGVSALSIASPVKANKGVGVKSATGVSKSAASNAPGHMNNAAPVKGGIKSSPGSYTTKPMTGKSEPGKVSTSGIGSVKTTPKTYTGPSSGSHTNPYTTKPTGVKKYEYSKPKTYTKPTRPGTNNSPAYSKPASTGSEYQRPKTSRPGYTKPRQSTSPSYQKPSTTRPKATTPRKSAPNYSKPRTKSPSSYSKPRSTAPTRQSTKPTRTNTKPRSTQPSRSGGTTNRATSPNRTQTRATAPSRSNSRATAPSRSNSRASAPSRSSSRASAPRSSSPSRSSGSRSSGSRGSSRR